MSHGYERRPPRTREPSPTVNLHRKPMLRPASLRLKQKMLQTERNFLIRHFGIKASRIKTINGGYRKWRGVELWLVPPGDPPPFTPPGSVSKVRRRR